MNTDTTKDQTPVYGIRPQKPGMYLGLFHGRDTPHEAMHGWGFDGPALGPTTANICGQGEHKMPRPTDWTRSQTLAAFHIYL